jgi:Fe-S cluster biosynthesis and repair protein YggX
VASGNPPPVGGEFEGARMAHCGTWHNLAMARTVQCIKLGKEADGLDFPPVPGEMGKKLWESVSKQAWQDWLKHQTMLVNEYRLNLSDPKARKYLAQQLENHFWGSGADTASGFVPPTKAS